MEKRIEESIEKLILAGTGAVALTKEKVEEIVEELIKKGEIKKKERGKFTKELLEKGKDLREEIERIAGKAVANVLDKLNIPTKSDINALKKKIDTLAKKVEKLQKK